MRKKSPIYIFVSGGVISGLGKGITSASVALLLKSAGFKVSLMKADMYLNQDAGTMNPLEHGEVFVTDDGLETDEDLGHYERFLDQSLGKRNYITAGQIYRFVLEKERRLEYQGRCIDAYIEIPQEIMKRWEEAAKGEDFFLVELGGTVGEYQNTLFFEAARRLKIKNPGQVFFVHVVYLPIPNFLGEMKSKPAQQSILVLNALGIFPDFIVCRSDVEVDKKRREKIALSAALPEERIFSAPDVKTIYEVPLNLQKQKISETILKAMNLKAPKKDLTEWSSRVKNIFSYKDQVRVAMVGKYQNSGDFVLSDSYVSVVESIKHACWSFCKKPEIIWVNSEDLEKGKDPKEIFKDVSAVIVPGGFGGRGAEGKILTIKYCRENKIPFLGLCYGMQLAMVEYARNVLQIKDANSTEIDSRTKNPVIHIIPEQEKKMLDRNYGATMRLGAWRCRVSRGTQTEHYYKKYKYLDKDNQIEERHRHRFEFNNKYRDQYEKSGLIITGTTLDDRLVEIIELSKSVHPFFVGVQFHPEFKSRFLHPHPLFLGLIERAIENGKK